MQLITFALFITNVVSQDVYDVIIKCKLTIFSLICFHYSN